VQPGDTLYRIALKFGVTMDAIIRANNLKNANFIYIGQRLVIPGVSGGSSGGSTGGTTGGTYIVKRGDTLYGISRRNGITVDALKAANGLRTNIIFVGQRLVIPGSSGTTTTPSTGGTTSPTAVPPSAPVPAPSSSGGFELGGQVAAFSRPDLMKFAGMAWVKQQIRWAPGADPNSAKGMIDGAHGQGFKILISILGTPSAISGGANYASYATFAGGVAALGADAIEVWNEMNIDREWPAGQISASSYVSLLRQAYTQIKSRNAGTMVISGAPAPTGFFGGCSGVGCDDAQYIQQMVAAGGLSYADCVGLHYNEGILPPSARSGDPRGNPLHYTRYYGTMSDTYWSAIGGKRKMCFTEIGYLTDEGYPSLESTAPGFVWATDVTVANQAQWLADAYTMSRDSGRFRMMIVFNVDFTQYGADPQAGYAIIRPGGSCPACDSLHNVTGGR
ncbi:MAG: LysM peptidoglycan-binding domain-containing protein, partial [Chloroflexi bacterium]|nr:LysM peptidoglycan-binding domain-containing protein [Chloroflexota bacterium]